MKKQIACVKCGVKLDRTDWEILKYHNQLPICDECELQEIEKKEIPAPYKSKLRLVE